MTNNEKLVEACEEGKAEILQLLLNEGANPNIHDDSGITPLYYASLKNHKDVVSLLLTNGAKVNEPLNSAAGDSKGLTPLYIAAVYGHVEIAENLINAGADIDCNNNIVRETPLHGAVGNSKKDIVELLIKAGADYTISNTSGRTPLKLAIENGQNEMVAIMKSKGSTTTTKMKYDIPPTVQGKFDEKSFDKLVDVLTSLSQEGYQWGCDNNFPLIKDYPQYDQIRKIGKSIYMIEGIEGLQRACHILNQRVSVREGGGQYLAEYTWTDIGGWRP